MDRKIRKTIYFLLCLLICLTSIIIIIEKDSDSIGFERTVEIVRGADYATLKVEVDATMTDVVRMNITNQVIDSVLRAEGDLVRNKKPSVCADYQSKSTTIMVELDYK